VEEQLKTMLEEGGVPKDAIASLRGRGVTTLKQLIALAALPDAMPSLAEELGLGEPAYETLMAALKSEVSDDELERLERWDDPSGRLGCLIEEVGGNEDDKAE
jgi:hypothetical protein